MKILEVVKEAKDIDAFISSQSPMVQVPVNGARAKIFTNADRQAIERFIPDTRNMTDWEALESAKTFFEVLLNRIKSGETLARMDQRIVAGLYDIIRKQTDRYDTFMKKHGLNESA
jgi:ribosome assembly protein YihI (activator of Der GTPase)